MMSCGLQLFVVLLCLTSVSGQLCGDDKYQCEDGRCIPASLVCDTIVDCRGGGDEDEACFHCSMCFGMCLGNTEWCDGEEDCFGGLDEYCSEVRMEEVFIEGHYNFTSPNYPYNYDSNYGALWTFSTLAGRRLLLTFDFILTEVGDYLLVGNGNSSSGQVLKWSGGPTNQLKVLSVGSSMWIKFLTDNSGTETGFAGCVDIFNGTDTEFSCDGEFDCMNGVCLPMEAACDDIVNCKDGADKYGAHCVCDAEDDYQCDDGICVPQYLVCDEYRQCSGGEDENEDCFYCPACYHRCLIFDPGWCDETPTCHRGLNTYHCKITESPREVFVTGDYNFTSMNHPENYDITSVFWEFTTYEGSLLLLTFEYIFTEANYDYVFVGNGNSSSGQVLKWTGGPATNKLKIISSGNILWMKFIVDDIITDEPGFSCSVSIFNGTSSEFSCDDEFDCMNGVCLPLVAVCDGVVNCKGGVDEENSSCRDQSCPSESLTYSGVYLSFPTTADGAIANSSETCGEDTSNPNEPLATRLCLSSEWDSPEFLPCYLPDEVAEEIENIADTPVTDENVDEVAGDLALLTTQTNDLKPEQIADVAESLEHISDTGSSSPEVTNSVIGTVNNVMTVDENELHDTEGTDSVVTSLEQQVSNVQQNPENYTDVQDNVGVQAVKVDPEITKGLTFVVQTPVDLNATDRLETDLSEETTKLYNNDGEVVGNDTTTSIYIPPAVLDKITEGHVNIPISFIIYKDARLFQTSDTEVSDGPVISSQVISATVENISVGQLPRNSLVITRFLTSNGNDDSTYRKCVFWVPSSDDTDGQWCDEGCHLVESSSQLTECHCDHLTSFAVLVGSDLSGKAENILNIFTIIASCMSIVALIVYSLTLLMFKTLRKMEVTKMRVNLSVSLLAFYVTFLLSDIAVGEGTMCKNFATAIHYFCLVTVSWMTVEAVYLFNMFVRVMQSRSGMKYYFPVSFLLAYSVPLVPVLVVRFHPGNKCYGNYCFLPPGNYLYYGFLLEVGLLIAVNTIIFIALVRAVVLRRNMSQSAEANRREIISRIRFLIIVWVLLGLSWIFGFLATIPNRKTIAFEVLFCIFISLQGVFVLVIVLVTNKEAKRRISSMRSTFKDGIATGMAEVTARSETYRFRRTGNDFTAGSSGVYSSKSSGAYVNSFTDITE